MLRTAVTFLKLAVFSNFTVLALYLVEKSSDVNIADVQR